VTLCPALAAIWAGAAPAFSHKDKAGSSVLVADFLYLVRAQPGYNRCPRSGIQGLELRLDALNCQLGRAALPAHLRSCSGQRDSGRSQQRCPEGW
jgi:hypothetical protein